MIRIVIANQTAFAQPSLMRVSLRVLAQACFGVASGRFPVGLH